MLRFRPSTIQLESRDIQGHIISIQQKFKHSISMAKQGSNVFGYPFPPVAKPSSSTVEEHSEIEIETDSQYTSRMQDVLSKSLPPTEESNLPSSKESAEPSLEEATNLRSPKGKGKQAMQSSPLSIDGEIEGVPRHKPHKRRPLVVRTRPKEEPVRNRTVAEFAEAVVTDPKYGHISEEAARKRAAARAKDEAKNGFATVSEPQIETKPKFVPAKIPPSVWKTVRPVNCHADVEKREAGPSSVDSQSDNLINATHPDQSISDEAPKIPEVDTTLEPTTESELRSELEAEIESEIRSTEPRLTGLAELVESSSPDSSFHSTPMGPVGSQQSRNITPTSEPRLPPPFSLTSRTASGRRILPNEPARQSSSSPSGNLNASPAEHAPFSGRYPRPDAFTGASENLFQNTFQAWLPSPSSRHSPRLSLEEPPSTPGHGLLSGDGAPGDYRSNPWQPPRTPRPYSSDRLISTPRSRPGWHPSSTTFLPGSPSVALGPSTPVRTRMTQIYNDELPAEIQPQTPAGLSRNGLPFTPLRAPWTVPASRTAQTPFQPSTPTRISQPRVLPAVSQEYTPYRSMLNSEQDQENSARFAAWEERRRGQMENRNQLARGGDVLEVTPPRDVRRPSSSEDTY